MPLVLPQEDQGFCRPVFLSFDIRCKKQAKEATSEKERLLALGWGLGKHGDGFFELLPPESPINKGCLRILTDNGDDLVVWDRNDLAEIREAKAQFDSYLKKGYKAYSMRPQGDKGIPIDQFDPLLEQIILTPNTRPG
jgi:hypothetical protein